MTREIPMAMVSQTTWMTTSMETASQTLLEAGDTDPSTPPTDSDSDGVPDFIDTDSDDNGIDDGSGYAGRCRR